MPAPTIEQVLEAVRRGEVREQKCSAAQFVDGAGRVVDRQVCELVRRGLVKVENNMVAEVVRG